MDGTKETNEKKFNIDMVQLEKSFIPDCFLCVKEMWKLADYFGGDKGVNIGLALYLENETNETNDEVSESIANSIADKLSWFYVGKEQFSSEDEQTAGMENIIARWKENGKEGNRILGSAERGGVSAGEKKTSKRSVFGSFRTTWLVYLKNSNVDRAELKVCQIMLDTMAALLCQRYRDVGEIEADCVEKKMLEKPKEEKIKAEKEYFVKTYCQQVFKRYSQLPRIEDCNQLGLHEYEGRKPKGKIAFVKNDYRGNGLFIDVKDNNTFDDYTFTRKMLECVNEGLCLLVENGGRKVLGLTNLSNIDEKASVILEYYGLADWGVKDGKEEVLRYKRGRYSVSLIDFKEENKRQLKKYFSENDQLVETVSKFIIEMQDCDHGALLIVTKEPDVGKYCKAAKNGIKLLEPMNFIDIKDYIKGIATVDGAVILGYDEKCEAFSVILDKAAPIVGDPSRGSRYNSARKYVAGRDAVAIIISEDKTNGVEILHGLKDDFEFIENLNI